MPKSDLQHTVKHESGLSKFMWFAVYTATHHEKQVHEQLTGRRVDSYLPLYKADRHWKKRSAMTIDIPLFPNYVFVRITHSQRTAVLGTPGVYSIVGSGPKAWELSEREIETLRAGLPKRKVRPHPYLVVGDRARIKSGVMAGLEGVIVRQKNNLHLILNLDQIMQSIAIEVAPEELELISTPAFPITSSSARNLRRQLSVTFPVHL
jgi:transcriptional antiterminator RfaH